MKTDDQIRTEVRDHYSAIARGGKAGCCAAPDQVSKLLGYSDSELAAAPSGANLGLGCGNPQAIAELRAGEVVVDLGAGGGFDAFLAARAVGATGRVLGVDMSSDMVALARSNAQKQGVTNVEFRLGEIEHMPIEESTADVVISNCVINLAPDKRAVYAEAFRVLKPGGRVAISDVVALAPMPAELADDVAARCGCLAGAALAGELGPMLESLGFTNVRVDIDQASRELIAAWAPGSGYERFVASARITATKPEDDGVATKPKDDGVATKPEDGGVATKPGACCAPGCCG